jgi:pyruvate dehydrogenase (quinone)
VAHEFVQMATVPEHVRHLVDRAIRIALSQRTVTCVIIPLRISAPTVSVSKRS